MTKQSHFSKGEFISYNQVRMHDTDMAGILYFARQFRFAHDAFEDMFEAEGYTLIEFVKSHGMVMVVAHAEADYLASLKLGDKLHVHMTIEKIGTTSVSFLYRIYRGENELVGTVKMVHVALDYTTKKKMPVPDFVREKLLKYLITENKS